MYPLNTESKKYKNVCLVTQKNKVKVNRLLFSYLKGQ